MRKFRQLARTKQSEKADLKSSHKKDIPSREELRLGGVPIWGALQPKLYQSCTLSFGFNGLCVRSAPGVLCRLTGMQLHQSNRVRALLAGSHHGFSLVGNGENMA